jgi:hypothetical protein
VIGNIKTTGDDIEIVSATVPVRREIYITSGSGERQIGIVIVVYGIETLKIGRGLRYNDFVIKMVMGFYPGTALQAEDQDE